MGGLPIDCRTERLLIADSMPIAIVDWGAICSQSALLDQINNPQ